MLSTRDRPGKREIQNKVFSQVKNKTVFGLGGPYVADYINILINNGFKKIHIYENNINTINSQIKEVKKIKNIETLNYIFGDIHTNLNNINCFYDLDYCGNINSIQPFLQKINKIKKFAITMVIRGPKKGDDGFLIERILNKELFNETLNIPTKFVNKKSTKCFNNEYIIYKGYKYSFYTYRDTSPMLLMLKTKIT